MATATLPSVEPVSFESRRCPVTGLRVHVSAERLIMANVVAALAFLLIGGVAALLVALTRWPAVHLLAGQPELFYRFLTAHGVNMLLYWILFFEIAGLYFGGAVVLNARLVAPPVAWLAFALMAGGAVLSDVVIFLGRADVMWSAYVPLKADPLFYLGIIVFAVGALVAVVEFFATIIVAKAEGRYEGSLPLVTYGFAVAAIIAVVTLIGGIISYVPAFFWSIGASNLDPEVYRLNLWFIGHPSQQINLVAMVAIWYLLAHITVGAAPPSQMLSRFAFLLYILFINLGSVHHLLVDPGLSAMFKMVNTSYFMYLAVLGSLIHAFSIPAGIEGAQRAKGFNRGLFQWLARAPWKEPGFSALVLSIAFFGFLGGTTGVIFGHAQISILWHNTIAIPGHFHATVVVGTTLAFMGMTYYVIPLIARRELVGGRLAATQPYLFGIGVAVLSVGMLVAGMYGVPRRDATIDAIGAAGRAVYPLAAYAWMGVAAAGALLAVAGGVMYVYIASASLLFGKRIPAIAADGPAPAMATAAKTGGGAAETVMERHRYPGTLTLVFAFLAVFVAIFLADLFRLAHVWQVK